jgi:hypothetical protein
MTTLALSWQTRPNPLVTTFTILPNPPLPNMPQEPGQFRTEMVRPCPLHVNGY